MAQASSSTNPTVWDEETQTFHGGQDWKFLQNFTEDFSVTTNGLGTPEKALKAAADAIHTVHHYPPADFQPAISHLAEFLWPQNWKDNLDLLLMGNGASELIDLVIRSVRRGGWRPGGTLTQYKEYERSSKADGRETLAWNDKNAALTCLVNPTNPTGDYLQVEEMKKYIEEHCPDDHTIIIDESMQPWVGPHWREDSLIHQREWVKKLSETRKINVWVMTSWTKIWSCTGLRIGSVVAPTAAHAAAIKKKQVPWSVNSMALAFVSAVVKDDAYMNKTWEVTPKWRAHMVELLSKRFPHWEIFGKPYLSWIWLDTKSAATTEEAVRLAKEFGVPVRSGKPGYELPTFVRIAVRDAEKTATAFESLELAFPPADDVAVLLNQLVLLVQFCFQVHDFRLQVAPAKLNGRILFRIITVSHDLRLVGQKQKLDLLGVQEQLFQPRLDLGRVGGVLLHRVETTIHLANDWFMPCSDCSPSVTAAAMGAPFVCSTFTSIVMQRPVQYNYYGEGRGKQMHNNGDVVHTVHDVHHITIIVPRNDTNGHISGTDNAKMSDRGQAPRRSFTAEEVAKHCTNDDCWLIFGTSGNKLVCDVTAFLEDHPGGAEVLLDYAGQDAQDEFEDIGHSAAAREMLQELCIGTMTEDVVAMERREARKLERLSLLKHMDVDQTKSKRGRFLAMQLLQMACLLAAISMVVIQVRPDVAEKLWTVLPSQAEIEARVRAYLVNK
ncbi:TPA: hypothetical protein N0F65_003973 [Lagenidium giganteum]|uniref:Cytochrome b5 heme-binding domain-containing protein n=1 Tax=Lagenidium giganteum TaxID=4803 RepID=A0AAV2YRU8_9STRA|nr:TPA: hypothetical protein N0F65_003973 [Lagenidium giganteum]